MSRFVASVGLALLAMGVGCGESGSSGTPGSSGVGSGATAGATGQGGALANGGSGGSSADAAGSGGASDAAGGAAGSAGTAGADPGCTPEPVPLTACDDALEGAFLDRTSFTLEVEAPTTLSSVAGVAGESALRVTTEAGFLVTLRYEWPTPATATEVDVLRFVVRGTNTNTGWQGNVPSVTLEDTLGQRRTFTPTSVLYPSDGKTWIEVRIPLAGGSGFEPSGDVVDFSQLAAIEWTADTWEAGFSLDFDGLGFTQAGATCAVHCEADCHGRGVCDPAALGCVCEVGADGDACQTCRDGFTLTDGKCVLDDDTAETTWPNAQSSTNGDAWLQVHHQSITRLEPRVLALNFVNPSQTEDVAELLDQVVAGFREGSRPHAFADENAAAELSYDLVGVVDLRDGVLGRPPAPPQYPYENSTLFPRRPEEEAGAWRFDYQTLFSDEFAKHYGYSDPAHPGEFLTLCELIDSGQLNELWIVGSGDVPDVNAAEVLEHKQRYDAGRNPIVGDFDSCAGNGCFDSDVPQCARSVRIGFVNYNRGPGCFLHSQGHGLESTARARVVPALSEWFLPFAGFDLDQRYGLPAPSFYELLGDGSDASYPNASTLELHLNGETTTFENYVASCGNVHFPPNASDHYDYASQVSVNSDCDDFGHNVLECRPREDAPESSSAWQAYEALSPDCGGGYLVRWYQSMPGATSSQRFDDGRPMLSVWPFLFY